MIALLLLTMLVVFAVVALLGFVGCSFQPRLEKGWKNRKEITIDHRMVSGSSALANFPVLISIKSDTELASGTQDDGFDIQFRRSDEKTILPHEIETFDHATGQLIAWVQVPDLSPVADTLIYLYYTAFPSPVTNQQDPITLWKDYNAVWHLGKQADGTLNTNDSTQQNNGVNNGATLTDGQVDGAAGFDGTAAFIAVGASSLLDPDSTGKFTIEAWANTNTSDPAVNAAVVSKVGALSQNLPGYILLLQTDSEQNLQYRFVIDSVEVPQTPTTTKIVAGEWIYVVGVWDGTNAQLFLNGGPEGNPFPLTSPPNSANQTLEIGRYHLPTKGLFAGSIDEVRYSPLARSLDWILTTFRNLSGPDANEPGAFIRVGNQEAGDD
jgi:biopolymer transport protein ExbB